MKGFLEEMRLIDGDKHLSRLPLRVDNKRPSPGIEDDDAIVHAEAVRGQAIDIPLTNTDGITESTFFSPPCPRHISTQAKEQKAL